MRLIPLSLFFAGITLFSCSNESTNDLTNGQKMVKLNKNEVLSIAYDDAKELTDKDIFNMVGSFVNVNSNGVSRNTTTSFKITKRTYINKEGEFQNQEIASRAVQTEGDIISEICEVEFQNDTVNGLAVLATNAELPAIIAFIPNKGNDDTMQRSGANELLHAAKASYLYKAIKTKELVDSLKLPTLEKISKELDIPINEINYQRIQDNIILTDSYSSRVTAVEGAPAGIQKLPSSISPLVKTNWGQDDPYNWAFKEENKVDWIKTENNGKTMGPLPVGCVNVALAQIMGYTHLEYNPPLTFTLPNSSMTYKPNFVKMTQKASINDLEGQPVQQIQYLMLNFYNMNKTTSKKDWDGSVVESGVSEENMLNTMNRFFKYNPKAPFDGDQVWASLRNNNPVLMLTTNHAFIISGLLITEKASQTRQMVKTNDLYWHANLGWADKNTGYYQLDGNARTFFEAGGVKEWCYKMDCIKNIRAK